MRSLAANLIIREKIQTTVVRAKETSQLVERLVTKAKANDLASKRALAAVLPSSVAKKLVVSIAPRFSARKGGYTRIIKLGQRAKDGAPMAIVELLDRPQKPDKKDVKKAAKAAKAPKAGAKKKAEAKKVEEKTVA